MQDCLNMKIFDLDRVIETTYTLWQSNKVITGASIAKYIMNTDPNYQIINSKKIVCCDDKDESNVLMCDSLDCDDSWHMKCLKKVKTKTVTPKLSWFCPKCVLQFCPI